jgi:hypothetical protein
MFKHKLLIIKTQSWVRQIQFARLFIAEFKTLEEAKIFAKNYPHWEEIEIWEDWELKEEYRKNQE